MNGKNEEKSKVLVGCPVSDYHEYCTEQYIQAIKNLTYNNYDILLEFLNLAYKCLFKAFYPCCSFFNCDNFCNKVALCFVSQVFATSSDGHDHAFGVHK